MINGNSPVVPSTKRWSIRSWQRSRAKRAFPARVYGSARGEQRQNGHREPLERHRSRQPRADLMALRRSMPVGSRATVAERVLGVDEAGRGSLVGPLVVGGFCLPTDRLDALVALGAKDSKALTPGAGSASSPGWARSERWARSSCRPGPWTERSHEDASTTSRPRRSPG